MMPPMAAPTATPVPLRLWPHWARLVLLALTWLALVGYFHTPVREVMSVELDSSNYASYAYFSAHGFQYGTDVVPMVGPYGFVMYGWVYSGERFWTGTFFQLGLNVALASLTLWFFGQYRGSGWRWVWLAAHVAFTPFIEDLPIEWILLLTGFFLLQTPPRPGLSPWTLLAVSLLAFLSLIKGTHLLLGLATVAVVLAGHAWLRHWRQVTLLAGGYLGSLLFLWFIAGQDLLHLPAYVRGVFELATGYNDAMSLEEPTRVFLRGVLVSAGLATSLGWALWRHRREAITAASLTLIAGHAFVQWKHGFVRADGHTYIYFHFAIVAALAIYLVTSRWPAERPARLAATGTGLALLLITLSLCCAPSAEPQMPGLRSLPDQISRRFWGNVHHLWTLPMAEASFERQLAAQRKHFAMPLTRKEVDGRPIDFFGFEHGLIPLNELNYRPRPMAGGTFNVYTPALMQLNRDFLRDPTRRPDYYLVKLQTIDERLLAQDDGLVLRELLYRYRPQFMEFRLMLMSAVPGAIAVPEPRLLTRRVFGFGEQVEVPAVPADEILLARFELRSNWRGRLRNALYKSPPIFINLEDRAGGKIRRRLVPAMAASILIFSPAIETNADLLELYGESPGRAIGRFALSSVGPQCYAKEIAVEFYRAPRPPRMEKPALDALRARTQFPFANLVPESITAPFKSHFSAQFMHAPSEAVWKLTGTERAFDFCYGLDPEAYERGTTNGVEFVVEVRGPSGGVTRAFSRLLAPRTNPADRGTHRSRVTLPIFAPGSRLVLRTDPGPFGDTAWDWSYVTNMALNAGRFAAEQFPGFNRVPDAAEDEYAAVLELDGEKALLLHIPGILRFNLTGKEKRVAFNFGFQPGAYTGEGRTAGGDVVLELQRDHQPPREIFRRALRPLTVPTDRGRQSAEVSLPATAPGDVLALRTTVAPGANNSWGWTYLSRLTIE